MSSAVHTNLTLRSVMVIYCLQFESRGCLSSVTQLWKVNDNIHSSLYGRGV